MNFLTFELAGPIGNMGDYRNVVSLVMALLITGVADAGLFYIFKRGFCRAYIAITEFLAIFSWLFGFDLVLLICLAILVIGCIVFFVGNSVEAKTLIANNLKGKTPGLNVFSRRKKSSGEALFDREAVYAKVQTAVITMAKQKVGAIITFERKDSLNDVMKSGTIINAPVSAELLQTIFYPGTRLHDGAVIIRNDMIVAASVYYTPTTRPLTGKFGSRHRASIGISEICDAVTVVVSEETGRISIAYQGELTTVGPDTFLSTFESFMDQSEKEETSKD
jgi:uncharacterized protein (TIGR00159 family)